MPVGTTHGTSPLILTFPYVGVDVPPQYLRRLTDAGLAMRDTDRFLTRVFDGIAENATFIRANFSRYLTDVNAASPMQPPDSTSIRNVDSRGEPIWNSPLRGAEARSLHAAYFVPYHAAVAAQIARVRARHGRVILCDCVVSRPDGADAFGPPADLSVATFLGVNCASSLAAHLTTRLAAFAPLTSKLETLAEPGYTVRHFGKPKQNVHALQLRVGAPTYLTADDVNAIPDPEKLAMLQPALSEAVEFMSTWQPADTFFWSGSYGT